MPIILPEALSTYRVVSIDPGSINLGVCIFEIDFYNRRILSINPYTIKVDKLMSLSGLDKERYDGILYRLQALREHFSLLLEEKNPAMVVVEAPFFNASSPNAYGALLKTVQIIQGCVIDKDPGIFFHLVEPLLVKKKVGASLNGDKEKVKQALMAKEELASLRSESEWLAYDEHSIDAIAVGYGFLKC